MRLKFPALASENYWLFERSIWTTPQFLSFFDIMTRELNDVLLDIHSMIQRMHVRPDMYVGATDRIGTSETLDCILWYAHRSWAYIQDRDGDFPSAVSNTHASRGCGSLSFIDSYRLVNPNALESECIRYVLECWRDVGDLLGMERTNDGLLSPDPNDDGE